MNGIVEQDACGDVWGGNWLSMRENGLG